jgi:energy-coupling factor transporter ATP-binding protein EcfA2
MGYVPEEPYLYPHLSGSEYLVMVAQLRNLDRSIALERIKGMLQLFGLYGDRDVSLSSYSKGMRQKVLLSAALLHNPELILLDEPFSGLDVGSSLVLRSLIEELARRGKVVLFSSHELETVERVCSHVVILHRGKVPCLSATRRRPRTSPAGWRSHAAVCAVCDAIHRYQLPSHAPGAAEHDGAASAAVSDRMDVRAHASRDYDDRRRTDPGAQLGLCLSGSDRRSCTRSSAGAGAHALSGEDLCALCRAGAGNGRVQSSRWPGMAHRLRHGEGWLRGNSAWLAGVLDRGVAGRSVPYLRDPCPSGSGCESGAAPALSATFHRPAGCCALSSAECLLPGSLDEHTRCPYCSGKPAAAGMAPVLLVSWPLSSAQRIVTSRSCAARTPSMDHALPYQPWAHLLHFCCRTSACCQESSSSRRFFLLHVRSCNGHASGDHFRARLRSSPCAR